MTVDKPAIIASQTEFDSLDQVSKNRLIDRMLLQQPGFLLILKQIDKLLFPYECEAVVQLTVIIWLAFSNRAQHIPTIPGSTLNKILIKNNRMRHYVETDHDPEGAANLSFQAYIEIESMRFIYAALNGRYKEVIESERNAETMFYLLKSVVDGLSWAMSKKSKRMQ